MDDTNPIMLLPSLACVRVVFSACSDGQQGHSFAKLPRAPWQPSVRVDIPGSQESGYNLCSRRSCATLLHPATHHRDRFLVFLLLVHAFVPCPCCPHLLTHPASSAEGEQAELSRVRSPAILQLLLLLLLLTLLLFSSQLPRLAPNTAPLCPCPYIPRTFSSPAEPCH